ncbi:hypothetical protein HRI_004452600 [Hibiscus trionum]|uniref:Uncharacterized protein n=1 Tax=Hibiscus trionum TaxID=183268 RepID=A0A9W7J6M4_HIBTR|nr:hypothetical protein HRI_004452600 [Hibiscus trionum]
MEEPLQSIRNSEQEKRKITWSQFTEELKAVSYMAVPMVAVSVLQYLLQVVSVIWSATSGSYLFPVLLSVSPSPTSPASALLYAFSPSQIL